jgi:polo-like kinase 1
MASSSGGLNTNNISGISRNTMVIGGEAGKSTMGQKQTRGKSGLLMSGGKPM